MPIVAAMRAKPSRDPSHLVAAVGSSSSVVVWADPGCIGLQIAHGWRLAPTVVKRRAKERPSSQQQACQVERGLDALRCRTGQRCAHTRAEFGEQHPTRGRSATVEGSERKTKQNSHEVDSQAILLQGRGPSEGGLPGCPRGVPCRRAVDSCTHRSGRRVVTEAVGVSVRGARGGSRKLQEFLSRGHEPGRLVRPIRSTFNQRRRTLPSFRQTSLSQEKGKGV